MNYKDSFKIKSALVEFSELVKLAEIIEKCARSDHQRESYKPTPKFEIQPKGEIGYEASTSKELGIALSTPPNNPCMINFYYFGNNCRISAKCGGYYDGFEFKLEFSEKSKLLEANEDLKKIFNTRINNWMLNGLLGMIIFLTAIYTTALITTTILFPEYFHQHINIGEYQIKLLVIVNNLAPVLALPISFILPKIYPEIVFKSEKYQLGRTIDKDIKLIIGIFASYFALPLLFKFLVD